LTVFERHGRIKRGRSWLEAAAAAGRHGGADDGGLGDGVTAGCYGGADDGGLGDGVTAGCHGGADDGGLGDGVTAGCHGGADDGGLGDRCSDYSNSSDTSWSQWHLKLLR
jgi:hypothetical protein